MGAGSREPLPFSLYHGKVLEHESIMLLYRIKALKDQRNKEDPRQPGRESKVESRRAESESVNLRVGKSESRRVGVTQSRGVRVVL